MLFAQPKNGHFVIVVSQNLCNQILFFGFFFDNCLKQSGTAPVAKLEFIIARTSGGFCHELLLKKTRWKSIHCRGRASHLTDGKREGWLHAGEPDSSNIDVNPNIFNLVCEIKCVGMNPAFARCLRAIAAARIPVKEFQCHRKSVSLPSAFRHPPFLSCPSDRNLQRGLWFQSGIVWSLGANQRYDCWIAYLVFTISSFTNAVIITVSHTQHLHMNTPHVFVQGWIGVCQQERTRTCPLVKLSPAMTLKKRLRAASSDF